MPAACVAASPKAQTICFVVSPSSLPIAAAAPNTPVVDVMCQPAVVVRRIDRVADSRFDLEAQDERVHEVAARHRVRAGVREQRGADRHARMDVVLRQRVVVLVHVRADAVQERGVQRVEALRAAEHARVALARERGERCDRDVERGLDAAAERAAEIVDDRALRFVLHVARDRVERAVDDIGRERLGDGHREAGAQGREAHAVDRRQRALSCCQ